MQSVVPAVAQLDIEPEGFRRAFAREPFAVTHGLVDHPTLTLEGIARLADALPRKAIERHRGDLPLLMPGGAPELDGQPSETVLGIRDNGCWMVLWNIEQLPEGRDLLNACLDEVERLVGDRDGGMCQREGFIFLSAPGAVTPAHFDPEHNLLLQIAGVKEMNVGRFPDPREQQRELERYFDGGHRNLSAVPSDARTFRLHPGEGVYVYPFAPHWVRNGPEASVSLSITFRTRLSERTERAHAVNARLRRLHLSPRPAGSSPRVDHAKASLAHGADRIRGWRRARA
jgi:hypothetical protein